jgi:hypothetical protein
MDLAGFVEVFVAAVDDVEAPEKLISVFFF